MIRCKDCKWWENERLCNNKKGMPIRKEDVYIDPTNEKSWCILLTGANFGCVHGEKKE